MRHDNTSVALEAAHIKWKQHGGHVIVNGLALCAIHHKAFDKGSLGVDENMRVQISSAVNGNSVVSRFLGLRGISNSPPTTERKLSAS
jgi:putative restriction endonuclease